LPICSVAVNVSLGDSINNQSYLKRIQKRKKKYQQLVRLVFVIWFLYSVTFVPYVITVLLRQFSSLQVSLNVPRNVSICLMVNSSLNIFKFIWCSEDFRKELKAIFKINRN
jgi:hypothetical protein